MNKMNIMLLTLAILSTTVFTGYALAVDIDTNISTGIITSDLNSGLTPTDLVSSLLGGGVTVSNVVFTGNNRAAGLFSGGTRIIGFENGVILSSGDIKNVIGSNKQNGITTDNGLIGDPALDSLIPGYTTYDSAKLEFDFVPTTSQMTFNYVFGSDEYNEFANTNYNDVFGFFVNGNSAPFNIALLPGVTPVTPVSINNVNGGNPLGTNAMNPGFYRNNALYPVPPGATINTELDGLTVILTATANVNPGATNHIILAIADAGDHVLDSDVFIQGGSVISLKLSLTPLSAENDVGTSHTMTAKLVDVNTQPIPGKTITFTVSGPNAQTGTAVTDSNGIAIWSYIGSNPGTDTIVANGEGLTSNQVLKTWIQTNKPPVAVPGGLYKGNEGSQIALDGSASYDPDTGDSIASYQWNFGDGNTDSGAKVTHTYKDNGAYTVSLTVTDTHGATDTKTTTANIANVATTVGPITAPTDPHSIGTTISISSPFTDPGILDIHTATIDWNDGSTTTGIFTETDGSGSVTGSHVYSIPGVYTITLTVTDKDGGVGTAVSQYVIIYDPNGEFVTGGGWIISPASAYIQDPSLTGKANFGFVSNYHKGATVPTGETEFQFQLADLNFHSASYDWLVVAGARAQYKGKGTINGAGNYGFLLTAVDGQVNGGRGTDMFRIKIWDIDSGSIVVYDNAAGSDAISSSSVEELSGGSIVIHAQ